MAAEITPSQRVARARGAARLRALGIDVAVMDTEQVRAAYEAQRAAYFNLALAGIHTAPIHGGETDQLPGAPADSRYGMLTAALADYYGAFPPDWPAPRHTWPGPGGAHRPDITVMQINQGVVTFEDARRELGLTALPPAPGHHDAAAAHGALAPGRWDAAPTAPPAPDELEVLLDEPEPADAKPAEDTVFRHWRT